jgi:hypothetical protein
VTIILAVLGCVTRTTKDAMIWDEMSRIFPRLLEEKAKGNIDDYAWTLVALFPLKVCRGLGSLTIALLMLFPAIGTQVLNLREVSTFLSDNRQGYKTTLSKLHQITLILGTLDIIQRMKNACEVRLKWPFTDLVSEEVDNSLAIKRLLSWPAANVEGLDRRREEYQKVCKDHSQVTG